MSNTDKEEPTPSHFILKNFGQLSVNKNKLENCILLILILYYSPSYAWYSIRIIGYILVPHYLVK